MGKSRQPLKIQNYPAFDGTMNSSKLTSTRLLPYLCLFFSGMASLIYELVWIRQLVLIFGGTLYAISAVLCAFMIGLALGAWAISLLLDRWRKTEKSINLVLVYGLLEGLIGLYGLCFPFALNFVEELYPWAMGNSVEASSWFLLMEFIMGTLLMLPATLLMGATLPIIGSWSIGEKSQRIFSDISILYSLNTFGAVAGCLFTQLFAIKHLGVQGTTWSAVLINALVFLACFIFKPQATAKAPDSPSKIISQASDKKRSEPEPDRVLAWLLLGIFFYSGMASLASEIIWTRVLVFPMGSTLYSFALILATFLFGIALGSLISEKMLKDSRLIMKFLLIELAIAIVCIGILPLFDNLSEWTQMADRIFYDLDGSAGQTLFIRSIFAFGLMLLPTLGFGLLFPLASRINLNLFGSVSRTLGNSYAVNTLGAVAGTVLAPFVLIPLFGIRLSIFVIYSILIILCSIAWIRHFRIRSTRLVGVTALSIACLTGGFFWSNPLISTDRHGEGNMARMEINVDQESVRLLDYKEGNFSTLSVVEDKRSKARTLYVDGFSTATVSNSIGGSAYMQAMGFLPMILHPDPKKAMVICFGTGNTMGTVAQFPDVQVDGVEIDRNVMGLAHWFSRWNHDVLDRPNVQMSIQDGRAFTKWSKNFYDVITLEPMSPVQAGVVNLYSKNFYEDAKKRLNPGGLMMQWLPLHLVGTEDARSILKTFQEVFPHTSVWNSFLTRIVLIVGSETPVSLSHSRYRQLMQTPEISSMAEEIGIRSFLDLADFYIADGETFKPYVQDAPVITDNHPLLEFSPVTLLPPLQWEMDESFLNLLKYRVDQMPPVADWGDENQESFQRYFTIRTAQRLAVFAKRYEGPGKDAFAQKKYFAGLESLRHYLTHKKEAPINLDGAKWND